MNTNNTQSRWKQRLTDFESALLRLEEALMREYFEELERDGVIQRFEFTFELAWKTLSDYLQEQGFVEAISPKRAIQEAFQQKLFTNGDVWLAMLGDRNTMSHLYSQSDSEKIFENIKDRYVVALRELVTLLQEKQ